MANQRPGVVGHLVPAVLMAGLALAMLGGCAGGLPPLARGTELLRQQRPKQAVAVFQEGIAEEPENGKLYLGLGRAYLALGNAKGAEGALAQAAALGEKPRANMHLARLRRAQGRFKDAAALLEEAISITPEDGGLHYELGRVQLEAGDNTRAAQSFETAIGLAPEVAPAYLHLADALAALNRHAEAALILEDALERVKSLPFAPFTAKLGELYEALDRLPEAERAYRRALAADPYNVEATAGRARGLWREGDHVNAIDLLRKTLVKRPKAALLHLELGLAYDEFRVPDKAAESLLAAVTLNRKLVRAYEPLLRLIDGERKRKHILLGVLAKAAKLFPDDIDIQLRFAQAAHERKKFDTVIIAAARVVELKPSHVEGNYLLGVAQVRTGDREAALDTYDALVILDPESADKLKEKLGSLEERTAAPAPSKGKPGKSGKKKKKKKGKKKRKRKRR